MSVTPHDPLKSSTAEVLDDPLAHAALFNAFPSLVWCADGEGGCSFVNQAWEDYTGRRLELERGAGWLGSVHPEDREALGRQWSQAFGLRQRLETEYRLRRADGDHGWVHHSAEPVTDEELDARPELVRTMSVQPPRGQGGVRVLEIEGVDLQPCGGTHVANTREVGRLAVTKIRSEGARNRRVVLGFA